MKLRTALFPGCLLISGCIQDQSPGIPARVAQSVPDRPATWDVSLVERGPLFRMTEIEVDGCDYLAVHEGGFQGLAHKGNCRRCIREGRMQ